MLDRAGTANFKAAEFEKKLDCWVDGRKAEEHARMRRVARQLKEWSREDNLTSGEVDAAATRGRHGSAARVTVRLAGESLAEAARAGRWAAVWAVMEERKREILRILGD